jgi:hypothetical protein
VKELEEAKEAGKRNMSIAEQRFSKLGRYKRMMRKMNRSRFQFTLMTIMRLDHKERENKKHVRT